MPFVQENAGTLLFVYHRKKLAVGNSFLSPFPDMDHVHTWAQCVGPLEGRSGHWITWSWILGSCKLSYVGIRILWNISNHSELPEPSLQLSFTSFQKKIHFAESSGKKHVWNWIKLRGTSKESCSAPKVWCGYQLPLKFGRDCTEWGLPCIWWAHGSAGRMFSRAVMESTAHYRSSLRTTCNLWTRARNTPGLLV